MHQAYVPKKILTLRISFIYSNISKHTYMAKETIADVISGIDINSEDAIVTLSDYLWQIGNIDTLKKELTDAAFNFQIAANVIGNYKGEGWEGIIEEHRDLLPYISHAMKALGIKEIAGAFEDISKIFPLPIDVMALPEEQYCEVINFLKGVRIGKFFTLTMDELKKYSPEKREELVSRYESFIDNLNEISGKLWNYGSPDNAGWGVVSRYLQEHLTDPIRK